MRGLILLIGLVIISAMGCGQTPESTPKEAPPQTVFDFGQGVYYLPGGPSEVGQVGQALSNLLAAHNKCHVESMVPIGMYASGATQGILLVCR